jgi:PAS domain S-box-containing protein
MQRMKFNQLELHQLNIYKQNIAKKIENIAIDLDIFLNHYHYMLEHGISEQQYISEFEHEMVMYCSSKINYEQLRILSLLGMELMRVNCHEGQPEVVPKEQLQDKSKRDYFLDAQSLQAKQIYVSPLNLNMEHGKTEHPLKPIVRLVMPLSDKNENKSGYLVINYNAKYFLPKLTTQESYGPTSPQGGHIFLINSLGTSYNPVPQSLYSGIEKQKLGEEFSFAKHYPQAWQILELNDTGDFDLADGLINFVTYYPPGQNEGNKNDIYLNQDIRWKVVSFVPASKIAFANKQFLIKVLIFLPIVLLIYLSAVYLFIKNQWQRQVLDEKLKANHSYLEAIMNNMVDGILSVDVYGRIHSSNGAFIRLSGYHQDQLQGKSLNFLFPYMQWSSDTDAIDWLKSNLNNQQVLRQEVSCRNKQGKNIPVEITFGQTQIDNESFYLLFIRDQSQQKEQEQELHSLDLKYRHREKIAEVGVLVGGILHEVSNPMAAIEGLLIELKENSQKQPGATSLSITSQENIDMIMEHVNRLKSISYEVSTFLKPNSEQFDLLDLNSVVNSATSLLRYDKRWHSIELEKHLDKQLPLIQGISDQLTQVLINLLINAADAYTNIIDRKHQIKVSTIRASYELICLSIEDNASGMSEEVSSQVFQQFYTTKGTGKGTGLGLSLCQSIIDEHNGSIEMESELGLGTTFRLYLPIDIDFREE